jgi:hypothetical protein
LPKCLGGMGFRDMKLFNQAFLARQARRLIQYPDSLCATLLKEKYFPRGELVDTVFPADASPTWRVVEHGLALLKKGQIWRVKSGEKVQIWRDPWIPRPPSFKPSLKKGRARLRWVSQLMKPGTYEWDEQVINSCLYPHDAKEVLNIRLTHRAEEDIIAWYYERSGIFSVKSGYKLALAEDLAEKCQTGSSAKLDGSRTLYNEIWSTRVLAKVKIFAWRLSQEGLATERNRKKRKLVQDAACQICACEDETGYHATVKCTKVVALRREMRRNWELPDEKQFTHSGPNWLLHLLASVDGETKACILLLLWRAWYLRNDAVHAKGEGSIAGSAGVLASYALALHIAKDAEGPATDTKR